MANATAAEVRVLVEIIVFVVVVLYFLFIDLNQFLREVISLKTLKPNFGGTRELFVQIDQNDSDRLGISSIVIQN